MPPTGLQVDGDDHGKEGNDCKSNVVGGKRLLNTRRNSSLVIEMRGPDEGYVPLTSQVLFTG